MVLESVNARPPLPHRQGLRRSRVGGGRRRGRGRTQRRVQDRRRPSPRRRRQSLEGVLACPAEGAAREEQVIRALMHHSGLSLTDCPAVDEWPNDQGQELVFCRTAASEQLQARQTTGFQVVPAVGGDAASVEDGGEGGVHCKDAEGGREFRGEGGLSTPELDVQRTARRAAEFDQKTRQNRSDNNSYRVGAKAVRPSCCQVAHRRARQQPSAAANTKWQEGQRRQANQCKRPADRHRTQKAGRAEREGKPAEATRQQSRGAQTGPAGQANRKRCIRLAGYSAHGREMFSVCQTQARVVRILL